MRATLLPPPKNPPSKHKSGVDITVFCSSVDKTKQHEHKYVSADSSVRCVPTYKQNNITVHKTINVNTQKTDQLKYIAV